MGGPIYKRPGVLGGEVHETENNHDFSSKFVYYSYM